MNTIITGKCVIFLLTGHSQSGKDTLIERLASRVENSKDVPFRIGYNRINGIVNDLIETIPGLMYDDRIAKVVQDEIDDRTPMWRGLVHNMLQSLRGFSELPVQLMISWLKSEIGNPEYRNVPKVLFISVRDEQTDILVDAIKCTPFGVPSEVYKLTTLRNFEAVDVTGVDRNPDEDNTSIESYLSNITDIIESDIAISNLGTIEEYEAVVDTYIDSLYTWTTSRSYYEVIRKLNDPRIQRIIHRR